MINLQNSPKTPEELYEFFMNIAKPPIKSHVAYANGIQYFREYWTVNFYLAKTEKYGFWFRYKESDPPIWYRVYEKYKL